MKRKNTAIVILILVLISATYFGLNNEKVIGGDTDEHGCLGPAGYSWNESEKECVRNWETGEDRYQIQNFKDCVDAGYPVMESYPRQCATLGKRVFVEEIKEKVFCTEEQRNSDMCTFLWEPVCAYPEEKTYPNSCIACSNISVEYWEFGECD